jgi:hypothetical protein
MTAATAQTPTAGLQVGAPSNSGAVATTIGIASSGPADRTESSAGLVIGQTAQASQGGGQGSDRSPGEASTAAVPALQVGDQFTLRMATPLAVSPAWQAIPAVAQAVDGPLTGWRILGSATMGQDGSVQVSWTQALAPDGRTTVTIHGVAYDPKIGKPGVPSASTTVMAPQVARTALSGVLAGVNQYVQAEMAAQQTQVVGLTATITSTVPPFWQVLAGQLASAFAPAPAQTGGTVMVARIAAGTPIVVFVTAPSS